MGGLHSYASQFLGPYKEYVSGIRCGHLLLWLACYLASLILVCSLISLWQTTLLPFYAETVNQGLDFPWLDPKLDQLHATFPGESEFLEEGGKN